jgi:hypothetical protein
MTIERGLIQPETAAPGRTDPNISFLVGGIGQSTMRHISLSSPGLAIQWTPTVNT